MTKRTKSYTGSIEFGIYNVEFYYSYTGEKRYEDNGDPGCPSEEFFSFKKIAMFLPSGNSVIVNEDKISPIDLHRITAQCKEIGYEFKE